MISPTTGDEPYDIQIQGSDRKYPAVVLRRKHRGKGATILTISKNGQHASLYPDYEGAIREYLQRRQQNSGKRPDAKGGVVVPGESGFAEAV